MNCILSDAQSTLYMNYLIITKTLRDRARCWCKTDILCMNEKDGEPLRYLKKFNSGPTENLTIAK